MKKVVLMIFMMGIVSSVVKSGEVRDEDIKFTPKTPNWMNDFYYKKAKVLYGPVTEAVIPVADGTVAPEGYHREGSFYVKKLPISGRHEFYNQFIEGYEPKESFENKMLARRNPQLMSQLYGEEMSQKQIDKRAALLANPEYQEKEAKEREWLLNVEKGRISPTRWMAPKMEQSQSYWSRFINWLWSGNSNRNAYQFTPTRRQASLQDMPNFEATTEDQTRE